MKHRPTDSATAFLGRHALHLLLALFAFATMGCAQFIGPQPPAIPGPKRVVIDKTTQTLSAYEGDVLILQTRVSTGRMGRRTPAGNFKAGYKERMHYSSLYDNAPMPWSIQVSGNYFIHGYSSVPNRPASHGCIRLPLTGDNPARRLFEWIERGTPIAITGEWAGNKGAAPPK